MFPLLPKGDQTKLLKFFWLKIFSICHRCRWHWWQTLSCKYLREFSKKFETVLMEYSGAGGKLIHEKNQKQKISWHCPFNLSVSDKRQASSFKFTINKQLQFSLTNKQKQKSCSYWSTYSIFQPIAKQESHFLLVACFLLPDEAGGFAGPAHPAHQPREEEAEANSNHRVGPHLQHHWITYNKHFQNNHKHLVFFSKTFKKMIKVVKILMSDRKGVEIKYLAGKGN